MRLRGWDGTWREFTVYLSGLFSADTRTSRHFAPDDNP